MAIFIKRKEQKAPPARITNDESFKKWYERQKVGYNATRRNRYHQDPEYKKKVLEAAQKAREARRKGSNKPEQYTTTLTQASEVLDVTIWTLRNWRNNDYFPPPFKFNGELWFTDQQIALIGLIKSFLVAGKIRKMSAAQRQDLAAIVARIHTNWEN